MREVFLSIFASTVLTPAIKKTPICRHLEIPVCLMPHSFECPLSQKNFRMQALIQYLLQLDDCLHFGGLNRFFCIYKQSQCDNYHMNEFSHDVSLRFVDT